MEKHRIDEIYEVFNNFNGLDSTGNIQIVGMFFISLDLGSLWFLMSYFPLY